MALDPSGMPFDHNGMQYVAVAPHFRNKGGTINWDNDAKMAAASLNGRNYEIQMANESVMVDGQPISLSSPPIVIDGMLVVPEEFLSYL